MKLNKTLTLAALVAGSLFAGGLVLQAQDTPQTPPPGGKAGGRGGPSIEMLTTNLSLTAEQVPKVKAVLDDQRKKMADLRSETDQDTRRTKMQDLRKETTAKMKDILTTEQFDKWQKMAAGQRRRPAANN